MLYPAAAKPTPTPEPAPEILPSNVDSKPANYLLLTNGYIKSVFDDEKQGYSSFKGLVETIDGHVMVNINLLAEHLYTLKDNLDNVRILYHNIDSNSFSIVAKYGGKFLNYTSTLIFERNKKEYKQIFSNSDEIKYYTADIAPYVSKNNGFDYIDPKVLKPLFKHFNFEINYYTNDGTKTLESEGYKGYSGVVVIDKYNGKASLPKSKQIYYSYDLSGMSKFKLDKLPYTMIYGVRIYGTDKFIKPSKKGGDGYDWGYYDLDLQELAYVADSNFGATIGVDNKGYSLTYDHMGNSDLWTLRLTANSNTDEYRLKIHSGYLGAGLSNDFGQSHLMSYDGTDRLVRNVRYFLKAFLYKISSTPELLYDAILDSWLADSDRVSDKKFIVVGDAKIKFDNNTYEYVIKSAKK